jgi:hypothetical protein
LVSAHAGIQAHSAFDGKPSVALSGLGKIWERLTQGGALLALGYFLSGLQPF